MPSPDQPAEDAESSPKITPLDAKTEKALRRLEQIRKQYAPLEDEYDGPAEARRRETVEHIFGDKAAQFEEPPPKAAEPPEPAEVVGEALTRRQLAFCERYVECPVAVHAARAAGYAEATAAKQASRLLKHPRIMRRIMELRRKRRLEHAFRRETLMDMFEAVFAAAIARNEFHAANQALTMLARLAQIGEAMPGFRYVHRFANGGEQLIWEAVTRLEQKLTEISVGDFAGAAAAVPETPFAEAARVEAYTEASTGTAAERMAMAVRDRRKR